MKKVLLLLPVAFIVSCSSAYTTMEFSASASPAPPDYSKEESWAVLPSLWNEVLHEVVGAPESKAADVFFIYPTLFTDRKNADWNADIYDKSIRKDVIEKAVAYQASAWVKAANLYVPFYRQAHYRIFVEPYSKQGKQGGVLAYSDVKKAFKYYLDHYNNGKPIIIASHSQGTIHAKRLLKEFFDGKPLQKNLIAAYLIGSKILQKEFKELKVLNDRAATGGFISWNTYKKNSLPKSYEKWYKGGVVTNPITWDSSETGARALHKGVLASDKKIYPQSLSVEKIDGMLWSSVPKIKNRFLLSFIKNYHFADINLFWKDIQENAVLRTQTWLSQNKE